MSAPLLLVMAKAPIPGFAKTRLCPPATPLQAALLAAACLLDTVDAARATGAPVVVALAGSVPDGVLAADVDRALRQVDVIGQRGDGLAERLANVHADTARLRSGAPVLQIGMDTPQLTATQLAHALDVLSVKDAAVGAATDGGWWALGLRDPAHAAVLRDVPMSTPDTGARTRLALRARGLRVVELPVLSDVDTMADALRVAPAAADTRFAHVLDEVLAVRNTAS